MVDKGISINGGHLPIWNSDFQICSVDLWNYQIVHFRKPPNAVEPFLWASLLWGHHHPRGRPRTVLATYMIGWQNLRCKSQINVTTNTIHVLMFDSSNKSKWFLTLETFQMSMLILNWTVFKTIQNPSIIPLNPGWFIGIPPLDSWYPKYIG